MDHPLQRALQSYHRPPGHLESHSLQLDPRTGLSLSFFLYSSPAACRLLSSLPILRQYSLEFTEPVPLECCRHSHAFGKIASPIHWIDALHPFAQ